jgi:hypothetical protein
LIAESQGTISYAENEEGSSYKTSVTIQKATNLLKTQNTTISFVDYLKIATNNLSLTYFLDIPLLDVLIVNSLTSHLIQLKSD